MRPREQSEHAPALTTEPWPRRVLRWVAHVGLFYGVLCLITLPTSVHALWVWGGVAVIAATVADLVLGLGEVRFRPRGRWLLRLVRLPGAVVTDTWLLARRLAGGTSGESRFEGVELPAAGDDDAGAAAARRALAEVAASVAPNVFALGVDDEHGVLVVHQLVPREDVARAADPLRLR